ncbi:MAG TPA: hypothetical protein VEX37_16105, partial [Thermomicrobiales bacterium]|nr:hypothetical protein [Thermomicrobiales bacterium]
MTPALQQSLLSRRSLAWLVGGCLTVLLALLSYATSPAVLMALLLLVLVTLALLRWPWLGVVMLIASVPVQQLGAVGGGALTLTRASLAAAVAGLLIWWTVHRRPIVGSRLAIPFVALIAWMLVTAHVARDLGAASSELFRWLIALFALF